MTYTFLQHELKAFKRSRNSGKSIAIRIVMGVLILYLLLNALAIGIFLDEFLKEAFPHRSLIGSFCGILLVYYLFDMISRMQLQELPTLRVQPYLQLPIKRNALVSYLALTALISAFNIVPLILFVPFIIKVVAAKFGGMVALVFIISLIGFTICNNYLALYIKRKANLNGWVFFIVNITLILITLCDYKWHLFSLRDISYSFFGRLIAHPVLVLLPLLLAAIIYYINFLYLKQNLYLEELSSRKATVYKSSTEFPILNRFGIVGDLVAMEVKLILRNKRSKSALVMGAFILFYGLIFYPNPGLKSTEGFKVFVGMFMTGFFIINYGQFMFSWQAAHFDGLMVSKIKFVDFLKAKYLLFTIVSTGAFILTIPYVYFGWNVLLIHFIMVIWNLGVNTTIVLFFANRNSKRIDLSKSASFNWEGIGASQLLLSFPLILLPYVIYIPFKMLHHGNWGLALLGIIGLAFMVTRNYWIKLLATDFDKRKFKIAEGFRDK